MAREIRVTIDDDEVFERLRARKRELDLSWEDVLHRGLRGGPGDGLDEDIGDRLERQITQRVEESLGRAFGLDDSGSGAGGAGGAGGTRGVGSANRTDTTNRSGGQSGSPDPTSPSSSPPAESSAGSSPPSSSLDAEMETLENAEDAVLRFPFLDDDPGNTVPLRVNLETSADGLGVEVVTIRSGKSVAERNGFDRGARRQIAEALATGEMAILELDAGVEEYHVVPVLSWSHDDGTPTVTDVSISEVSFDA